MSNASTRPRERTICKSAEPVSGAAANATPGTSKEAGSNEASGDTDTTGRPAGQRCSPLMGATTGPT